METEKFKWDSDAPFARAKWETQKANRALKDYIAMGPGRSLTKLHKVYTEDTLEKGESPTKCLRTLKNWSSRYDWQARLACWDELEREDEEETWRDRRRKIREGEWGQARILLDRVEQMLKFPLAQVERVEETYIDGRPKAVTIVNPVRWSQRDVARFMQVASELGRLAAEMEQQRLDVRITEGELDDKIAEELARLERARKDATARTAGADADTAD